jgi:hypothetical protein
MASTINPQRTTSVPESAKVLPAADSQPDIKIYSHSPILYWWPVWAVGFLMALLTYLDGGRMAYVPDGTRAEGNKLIAPQEDLQIEAPQGRMAHSQYLGTFFFLTLLVVFVSSNVQLRGLWEWITILVIALVISVISMYGLWGRLLDWLSLLHIHINLAGYVFISAWMFAIWVFTVFVFDRRTYIIFSAGQVRVLDMIGASERVYDVTNMTFQVRPNVFFRHRILGFYGAGDLVVSTGGPHPEVLDWPNVLFARSRLKEIQERLKSREVV